jgi:PAS domain S-box
MVLTAYDERTFRMAALEAGATDFLLSPVDHTEFLSRARNLLQLRKQQKLLESRATVLADELLQSERAREEIVRNDREVLEQVIDTVPAFIMAADRSGRCIFVNASQARHAGGAPSDYVGLPIGRLLGDRARLALEQDHQIFLNGRPMPSIEEEIIGHDGTRRIFDTVKTPLRDARQNIVGVVTISTDITARKVAEEQMTHMAHHDALTGLPNRVLLLDRIQMEIARRSKAATGSRCCSSILIASKRSMTVSAIQLAIGCCRKSQLGWQRTAALKTWWPASAATNSLFSMSVLARQVIQPF